MNRTSLWAPFDLPAMRPVAMAQFVADGVDAKEIGTGHFLLGALLSRPETRGIQILKAHGVDEFNIAREIGVPLTLLERLKSADALVSPGAIPLSTRLREVVEIAGEGGGAPDRSVDFDHMLLALLDIPESTACRTLKTLGVDAKKARREITTGLNEAL